MVGDDNPLAALRRRTGPPVARPLRDTEVRPLEAHVEQLAIIGELMMGAAWADGDKAGIEVVAICEQLKEFVEAELLPATVKRRIDRFDPERFDVEAACEHLSFGDDEDRLAIVRLVATVTGADRALMPGEIAYMHRVARAIGLDPNLLRISVRTPGATPTMAQNDE